jgi:hypothetical protein
MNWHGNEEHSLIIEDDMHGSGVFTNRAVKSRAPLGGDGMDLWVGCCELMCDCNIAKIHLV